MTITAESLIDRYLEVAGPSSPRKPRKKSLAMKQGERCAGRTQSRRQYTEERLDERAGYLIHNYYYAATSGNSNSQ